MACRIRGVWHTFMKTSLLNQHLLSRDSIDTDPIAGRLIMERAIELATLDGRLAIDLSSNDWNQAKRELSGEADGC